jgi:hypothetical protein
MPSIDYKTGGYKILAKQQNTFTFWWGSGSHAPNEYFDVFISPELPAGQNEMQPLTEVSRTIYFKRLIPLTLVRLYVVAAWRRIAPRFSSDCLA